MIGKYNLELGDYTVAKLSFQLRNGELTQPSPNHSNPEDYGKDRKWATQCKIRFLKTKRDELQEIYNTANRRLIKTKSSFDTSCVLEHRDELEKINKEIKYQTTLFSSGVERKSYDIAAIKRIPLSDLTLIHPSGFFHENPFRTENVPSDSLHWEKRSNRYKDFGSGAHGDSIDLYMALRKVDLKTALKEMSSML
jgi:hypothetical protein